MTDLQTKVLSNAIERRRQQIAETKIILDWLKRTYTHNYPGHDQKEYIACLKCPETKTGTREIPEDKLWFCECDWASKYSIERGMLRCFEEDLDQLLSPNPKLF